MIFDITGREITRLVKNEFKKADFYAVMFNGCNIASGIYFCKIKAGNYNQTIKIILLK